ncbi:MAG: (2Fe-2S) ferredoxin domain-containing protein [Spirochaetaceae bacterium]|nr:MAG: (2Fe-2S) ferredoxin domain-containing protein [Spirochaetaceae bacterium]
MAKMTLEELRKLRQTAQKTIRTRESAENDIHLTIGMGTSGIAAGAKDTLATLMSELEKHPELNVAVRQTGGLGLEHAEPTLEVRVPGMPVIIYGKVAPDVAQKIVQQHLINKELVDEHIYDRPASDIVDSGSAQ